MGTEQVATDTEGKGLVPRVIALILAAGAMLLLISWAAGQEADPAPDPPVPAEAQEADAEAVAEVSAGAIEGTVTNVDGKTPWPGLVVALISLGDGSVVTETLTDAKGAYVLGEVPEGTYRLQVSLPGLSAVVQATDEGGMTTLNVVMPTLLLAPTPTGIPEELQPKPVEGVIVAGDYAVTLLAAPLTHPNEPTGATGPARDGHPGKPKPPRPPGRPEDKPPPPPFVSPDEP